MVNVFNMQQKLPEIIEKLNGTQKEFQILIHSKINIIGWNKIPIKYR